MDVDNPRAAVGIPRSHGIVYVLPSLKFFLEGRRGRVSHAVGFVSGLLKNGWSVQVVSGEGAHQFFDQSPNLEITEISSGLSILWWKRLLGIFRKNALETRTVICRWRPVLPFLLFPLLHFHSNRVWLEMNSFSGIDSSSWLIRTLVRKSLVMAQTHFNLIFVSENSANAISAHTGIHDFDYLVIPNGFESKYFTNFEPMYREDQQCTLVYFGTRQSYYSWDLLYDTVAEAIDENWLSSFQVYGFMEKPKKGVISHGAFELNTLPEKLSEIVNPVFVLHANSSELARSGSPMKFYEYVALGAPMLVSDSLGKLCYGFANIVQFSADDVDSLSTQLRNTVINYPRLLAEAKTSQQRARDTYSWQAVVKKIEAKNG